MSDNAVALAALGILGGAVVTIGWVARFGLTALSRDLREHTKAAVEQAGASRESIEASKEVLMFMKNLNGKLAKATVQVVKEQHVDQQVVNTEHVIKRRKVQG